MNHVLHARVALAAALWHAHADPRSVIVYVAADTRANGRIADAEVVRTLLTQRYDIPAERLLLRRWSNCTVVEVRAVRVLRRAHGLDRLLVITHGYHARRTRAYFDEIGLDVDIVLPTRQSLVGLPGTLPARLHDRCGAALTRAEPSAADLGRERLIELVLSALHRVDRRGRVERWLAARLRGQARRFSGSCLA